MSNFVEQALQCIREVKRVRGMVADVFANMGHNPDDRCCPCAGCRLDMAIDSMILDSSKVVRKQLESVMEENPVPDGQEDKDASLLGFVKVELGKLIVGEGLHHPDHGYGRVLQVQSSDQTSLVKFAPEESKGMWLHWSEKVDVPKVASWEERLERVAGRI
jgi:hypothetical protein